MSVNRHQNDNPNSASAPPTYDPVIVAESSITKNDLRDILRASKRTGDFVCLAGDKKKILTDLLKGYVSITNALAKVDAQNRHENNDSIFKTRFESCAKKYYTNNNTNNKIDKLTNNALSDLMIDLFVIFQEVTSHPKFRSVKNHVHVLMEKMDDAVAFLIAVKEDGKEDNKILLRGEKRTSQQLSRKFMEGGGLVPREVLFQSCPYCQHCTVDEPPENANVKSVNADRFRQYNIINEKWNKFKANNGPCPRNMKTDQFYTRKPPLPKTEALILQCHCHQMTCARKGSDVGSTCIVGCLKAGGERCDWHDGMCTCSVCKCPCKKGYKMDNFTKIGIALTRRKTTGEGKNADSSTQEDTAKAKHFLGECMFHGANIAQDALDAMEIMNEKGLANISDKEKKRMGKVAFDKGTAAAISLKGGNLPITTVFGLQKTMLQVAPTTKVKTPNGIVDMRHPKNNSSLSTHRLNNNRLTTMNGSASSMTANVVALTATTPTNENAVSTAFRPRFVSIPESETIELSSTSSSVEEEDARKPPALDNVQVAASNMHDRIVKRARTQLTSLVQNRNRTNEENIKKKRLRKTVQTLVKENKEKGEHMATILDVTSNGKDLIQSPIIDSQDCLDYVMDLYDDE
mmetsp:Transcript_4354/g.5012  ORF Transcript_4354/g.5012 Transcript_4354/m.5012 type:complete len:631 (-) Transcript_4354:116-2008(-)